MKTMTAALIMLVALPAVAARPLAMRVDVQSTVGVEAGTTVQVEAQLAPEDRGRLGSQARMRVQLTQAEDTIAHILRDVDISADGSAQASFTWPPGKYALEVSLEALRGDAKGLWAGTIEVPDLNAGRTGVATATVATAQPKAEEKKPVQPWESSAQPTEKKTESPQPDTGSAQGGMTDTPAAPAVAATAHDVDSTRSTTAETSSTATQQSEAPKTAEKPQKALVNDPSSIRAPGPAAHQDLPVHMVVALDVTAADSERATSIARALEHSALAGGGRSSAFSSNDAATANAPGILRAALSSSLTSHFGAPVVLITDGRRQASNAAWKEAQTAARSGDVPVLVVGLWNSDFSSGLQKKLRKIASQSGGRLFFLQESDASATVVALYEEIVKANEN